MAERIIVTDTELKSEEIGKVKLDYSFYPGEDFYSDGQVEEELLHIARDLSPVEYEKEIGQRKNWPVLYHMSSLRENIVDWIPMKKTDKVLEVGSGCGAITGALMVLGTKGVISPAAVGEFRRRMAQKHNGMTDCAELLKANAQQGGNKKTHCDNMIYEAIELLDEMTE